MYTLIDEHNIKHDASGVIFNKRSAEYDAYVDYCNGGFIPSNFRPDVYEVVLGKYKGKNCYFCRRGVLGREKALNNSSINIKRRRGEVIAELCMAVINYITGRNDQDDLSTEDIDAMIATHGTIMLALQSNRPAAAKFLIESTTPDQYITQNDIDNVLEIYGKYEPVINSLV
jgi:hypothetical protein